MWKLSGNSNILFIKVYKTTKKFKAHDEKNECGIGDYVEIAETRPLLKISAETCRIIEGKIEEQTMVQPQSRLKVADNSVPRNNVYKSFGRAYVRSGNIGDVIVASVKSATPHSD